MALLGDLRVSIGAQITDFTAAMDRVERRVSAVEKKFDGLSKVGQRLRGLGTAITAGIGVPLAAFGAVSVRTFTDFERAINRVRALTGAAGEDFKALRDLAIEQGRATIFSATESAQAMGFLAQAGLETREVIEALPGALQLAAAGGLDLASAADIATNVLSGMQLQVAQLSSVNDRLALTSARSNTNVTELGEAFAKVGPIANTSGQSLDDVAAALGQLANQGIKGAEAGTAIRRILGELIGPSSAAKRAMADLGVTILDTQGQLRPLTEILGEFERAQARLGDQTQFTARLFEIFGDRGGPAMAALLAAGSEAVAGLSGELQRSEGFAQDFANTANQGVSKAVAEMKAAFETLQITLAEKLAPEITGLIQGFKGLIDGLAELDRETVKNIATAALWTAGIGGAIGALGLLAGAITNIVALGTLLAPALPFLGIAAAVGGGIVAIKGLIDGFSETKREATGLGSNLASIEARLEELGGSAELAGARLRDALKLEEAQTQDATKGIDSIAKAFDRGRQAALDFVKARNEALQAGQAPPEEPRIKPPPRERSTFRGSAAFDPSFLEPIRPALTKEQNAFNQALSETVREIDNLVAGFKITEELAPRTLEMMRFQAGQFSKSAGTLTNQTLDGADAFRELQRSADGVATSTNDAAIAVDSLGRKLGEQVRNFAEGLGFRGGDIPTFPMQAPDTEGLQRVQNFLEQLRGGSAEARQEIERLFQILETGTLDNTALDADQLQEIRSLLAGKLGFDELGAAVDPVQRKIERIAETLRSGIGGSDVFKDLKLQATNAELDRMKKTLEELELSEAFGIQLDETEEQIKRMRETLRTGLMPISGQQASEQFLRSVRDKLAGMNLANFQQDLNEVRDGTKSLADAWDQVQSSMEKAGATLDEIKATEEQFVEQVEAPDEKSIQSRQSIITIGAAFQGLLPIMTALQSATANLFDSMVQGAFDAKQALMDFGRAMLSAFTQIIARLAVAVALAGIASSLGIPFEGAFGALSGINISGKAIGGSVGQGEPYVVGERGPELFVPNRSGFIIPNHQVDGFRAAGGPVAQGRKYVVGEEGPEVFQPVLSAGLVPALSAPVGSNIEDRFSAQTFTPPDLDRGAFTVDQQLRVDVSLDDENLIATVERLGMMPPPASADELSAMIGPAVGDAVIAQMTKTFESVSAGLRDLGGQIESDVGKQVAKLPAFTAEVKDLAKGAAGKIESEAGAIKNDREAIASGNAQTVRETVDTNDLSQQTLDTVQVDLGEAVEAIQFAAGAALAAATINLIPLLASGGPIGAGQTAIVGEKGPELFRPRVGGEVISNRDSRRMMQSGEVGSPIEAPRLTPELPNVSAAPVAASLRLPPAARSAGAAFSSVPRRTGQMEPLRGLAQGGIVEKGETVLVGEYGPELFLTRFPTFQGWVPQRWRDDLGDEKSFRSKEFFEFAKWNLFLGEDLEERFRSPGGDLAGIPSDEKAKIREKAEEQKVKFIKGISTPEWWTAPASGDLLDIETATRRFAPLGFKQPEMPDPSSVFEDLFGGMRALGGPVMPGRPYLVGERGPEMFMPNQAGRILNQAQMPAVFSPSFQTGMMGSGLGLSGEQATGPRETVHRYELHMDGSTVVFRSVDEFARDLANRLDDVSRDYVLGGR